MNEIKTNSREIASEKEKFYTLLTITFALVLIIIFSLF